MRPEGSIDEPAGFDTRPFLEKSHDEIKNFSMGFLLEETKGDGMAVASGTLINTQGAFGILTAHHVAAVLERRERFGLSISTQIHAPWVEPKQFEFITIGENSNESVDGPDLSFLKILDVKLLGTIQGKKSFYHLDRWVSGEYPIDQFYKLMTCTHWCISGCPHESTETMSDPQGQLIGIREFIGEVFFKNRTERNGFDFIEIEMPTEQGWPNDCQGMSGGALWMTPIGYNPDNPSEMRHMRPILSGVNFYQRDRALFAHGFDSIYKVLRENLKSR